MKRHVTKLLTSFLLAAGSVAGANAQEVTTSNYYVSSFPYSVCSSNAFNCIKAFNALPNEWVLFDHISCYLTSTQPIDFIIFGHATAPGAEATRRIYLPVPDYLFSSNSYVYNFNQEIRLLVQPAGRYPVLKASLRNTGNASLECTITGVKLPPP